MTRRDSDPKKLSEDVENALDPEDLDITRDDRVLELDEDRYVVSTGDPFDDDHDISGVETRQHDAEPTDHGTDPVRGIEKQLRRRLETEGAAHGFDLTTAFDGETTHRQVVSNDLVATFEALLMAVTREIDDDAPPGMVLGILLTEANVDVRYPDARIVELLDKYDLGPMDSIADLVNAAGEEGEFRI